MEKEPETKKNSDDIYMILDSAFFIKLTPLESLDKRKYLTTQYIINEIRDRKAREYYELNKSFIQIKNPTKDSVKKVSKFAENSNDLEFLSIADLSIIALAYETIKNIGQLNKLNKKPLNYTIISQEKIIKEINDKKKENKKAEKEKNNTINLDENNFDNFEGEDGDEDDWITPENLYTKLDEYKGVHETKKTNDKKTDEKNNENNNNNEEIEYNKIEDNKNNKYEDINVFVNSADFTLQNVCMKMGIPILGVDGLRIKNIKNYILKCTVCNKFIFEINRQFCDSCGYPYLMRIGYNIFANGEIKIHDKKPEPRKRGQIFDLPAPTNKRNGTVYILSEDQIPKKGFGKRDVNIDKILENYENFKELPKVNGNVKINSSKEYKWGFPKQNPNVPKKHYNKRKK